MTQGQRNQDPRDRERQRNRGQQNQQNDDWAQQVPWDHYEGPYRDYGWERGESALPGFRDPDVHVQPYERAEVSRYHRVNWNREYDYGVVDENGPYAGVGPKNYQRSDERIMDDIYDRLTRHGQIDARDINIDVKNGEVTLTGTVDSRRTKRMTEDVVDSVRGVKDIHNQLRVQQQNQQGWQQGGQRGQGNQSGMPGGGKGRVDQVGGSGVYPASGPMPPDNAPVQGEASWGQGDRGAAGYQDSGSSELNVPPQQGQQQQDKGKGKGG